MNSQELLTTKILYKLIAGGEGTRSDVQYKRYDEIRYKKDKCIFFFLCVKCYLLFFYKRVFKLKSFDIEKQALKILKHQSLIERLCSVISKYVEKYQFRIKIS